MPGIDREGKTMKSAKMTASVGDRMRTINGVWFWNECHNAQCTGESIRMYDVEVVVIKLGEVGRLLVRADYDGAWYAWVTPGHEIA